MRGPGTLLVGIGIALAVLALYATAVVVIFTGITWGVLSVLRMFGVI